MAKKEKEALKRELRSRRKALRALCKVGGACQRGGVGKVYSRRPSDIGEGVLLCGR